MTHSTYFKVLFKELSGSSLHRSRGHPRVIRLTLFRWRDLEGLCRPVPLCQALAPEKKKKKFQLPDLKGEGGMETALHPVASILCATWGDRGLGLILAELMPQVQSLPVTFWEGERLVFSSGRKCGWSSGWMRLLPLSHVPPSQPPLEAASFHPWVHPRPVGLLGLLLAPLTPSYRLYFQFCLLCKSITIIHLLSRFQNLVNRPCLLLSSLLFSLSYEFIHL